MTPISGVMDLPVPSSLEECHVEVCAAVISSACISSVMCTPTASSILMCCCCSLSKCGVLSAAQTMGTDSQCSIRFEAAGSLCSKGDLKTSTSALASCGQH
eukprot:3782279-Amphidinium_carterae.2